MIERFFLYIKKNLIFLWKFIGLVNSLLLNILYYRKFKIIKTKLESNIEIEEYHYRLLNPSDTDKLYSLFLKLDENYLKYFNPHKWDKKTLTKVIKSNSFITLGFFLGEELVGYFFLRMFFNRKAFIGRLVSKEHQGKGIAKNMAIILYRISNSFGFSVYSTISKDNIASLKSHKSVNKYKIVKELPNNFYLIKFDNSEKYI